MNKTVSNIIKSLIGILCMIGNFFLAFYILNEVANLWSIEFLQDIPIKTYWGLLFINSIFNRGLLIDMEFKENNDNKSYKKYGIIIKQFSGTISLILIWLMSWVWTSIFY